MDLFKTAELDPSLLTEVRKLHFQTRRLADQGISGGYRSAFRGRGIEFEEVREYIPGDDVRTIDWKVTARTGLPFVKSYREERELTVMIAVDVSASTLTGTRSQLRDALIAKIGAVLTLVALSNNDKVGLVTFSDQLETYHPPRKARSAVWRIIHEVLSPGVYHPRTNLAGLFEFLSQVLKRRAILFVLSDFIGDNYERELAVLAKRHDVTAVRICDPIDAKLPEASIVRVEDPETGAVQLIDTTCPEVQDFYKKKAAEAEEELTALLNRHRVHLLELHTDKPFIHELRRFFTAKGRTAR